MKEPIAKNTPLWVERPNSPALVPIGDLRPHERVADRLADALIEIDEILGAFDLPDMADVHWMRPRVQQIYDVIDDLLKEICD